MDQIKLIESETEIEACYPVMTQLRPHLDEEDFLERVCRQMENGYRLAALIRDDEVASVAGFRINESLAWGRHLYVDDLVTDDSQRSSGLGQDLFDWLVDHAHQQGCQQLHLDSGVQRFDAHRFYLRQGMAIASHHFVLML